MCKQKEELLQKIEELKQQVQYLSNEYPKYMLAHEFSKCDQYIVKFTSLNTGKVVAVADNACYRVGYASTYFMEHINSKAWKEVTNPNELCGKDLVECWDINHTYERVTRFYDADNNCTFAYDGKRDGHMYDKYKKIMPWEYPEWAVETQKNIGELG